MRTYPYKHYEWMLTRIQALGLTNPYRATPTIRLLERRRAKGSCGSAIRPHSCDIFAVKTERLGSLLKEDFDPKVAASL